MGKLGVLNHRIAKSRTQLSNKDWLQVFRGREVLSNQEVLEAGSSPSDGSAALIFSRRPVCLNPDSDSSLVSSLGP